MNGAAQPRQDARQIAEHSARPLMTQERRVALAALRLEEGLRLLRDAQAIEIDREGPWLQAIGETAIEAQDALAGAQAIVIEMGKARRGES